MPDFSPNDINDARRRVREMRDRARSYVGEPQQEQNEKETKEKEKNEAPPQNNNDFFGGLGDIFGRLSSNEDSSLILALILILSREKADNMLILALLYILL